MPLKSSLPLVSLVLLLFTVAARADLAFVLTPSLQSGVGSAKVSFTGVLTNTSLTGNLYLNNVQFTFTDAATNYLAADTNAFFGNVPGILLPAETYQDILFGIQIAPGTPPGQYFGSVIILGGTDIFAASNLGTQTFQVSLPPSTLAITVSGTNLALSWPAPPGDYVLQVNPDLSTTNWQTVTNTATVFNGTNQVILPPATGSQFYRLEYP